MAKRSINSRCTADSAALTATARWGAAAVRFATSLRSPMRRCSGKVSLNSWRSRPRGSTGRGAIWPISGLYQHLCGGRTAGVDVSAGVGAERDGRPVRRYRPDCVPPAALDLLTGYREEGYEVWLELGLQTAHDKTLKRINRGHDFRCYQQTAQRARQRGLKVLPSDRRAVGRKPARSSAHAAAGGGVRRGWHQAASAARRDRQYPGPRVASRAFARPGAGGLRRQRRGDDPPHAWRGGVSPPVCQRPSAHAAGAAVVRNRWSGMQAVGAYLQQYGGQGSALDAALRYSPTL